MKKKIIGVLSIFLVSLALSAHAQHKGGYTAGAYGELSADESYIERMSDWFATLGKSEEEKVIIKSRRRAARKMADTQKAIARKKKEIAKKKKQFKKELEISENQDSSGNE